MTAALFCPGPSLATLDAPPKADLTIGVNRAACGFPCHWWAALDLPLIERIHSDVIGAPRLFTCRATLASLERRGLTFPAAIVAEDLRGPERWSLYTAPAALVLAAHLGARLIDVYGADWATDAPDFDGAAAGENRSAARFQREREIWDRIVASLANAGVAVTRHSA